MPARERDDKDRLSNGGPSTKRRKTSEGHSNGHSNPRLAFLGPVGTYGHQAATKFSQALFETAPELLPCPTIGDVWDADAEYLVLPLENTIGGGVRETLSCMVTDPSIRRQLQLDETTWNEEEGEFPPPSGAEIFGAPRIVADLDLRVDHSLIVKRGTKVDDVKWVKSHEQALAQCSAYLSRNLPDAKRIACSSTAAATASLLDSNDSLGPGAAIASKASIHESPDLVIMTEGIQNVKNNNTRFLLFTRKQPFTVPTSLRAKLPLCTCTEWFVLEDERKLGDLLQQSEGTIATILVIPQPHTLPMNAKYPKSLLVELDLDASQLITEHHALRRIGMREFHVGGKE